jgi:hypothetical protein
MAKISLGFVRAGDQDFGDAVEFVADFGVKLMFGAHLAAVLAGVVRMGFDFLCLHMLGVELQYLRSLMIDPNYCVEKAHRYLPSLSTYSEGLMPGSHPHLP